MEQYQYIIVVGEVDTGFRFLGPFQSEEDAGYYGDDAIDARWSIVTLENPVAANMKGD